MLVDLRSGNIAGQVVADGSDDGADLVLGDDLLVELLRVVGEVLVDLLPSRSSRVSRSRKVVQ